MPGEPIVQSIGDYYISSTIGHGWTGRVKLGIHRTTGSKVAIKIIPRAQLHSSIRITEAVEQELAILQLLHHPNLIELYQILQDDQNIYFITEYVPGGELYHVLNECKYQSALTELEAKRIFSQIASALDWCHARHICHRDLKPENILLDKDQKNIKIADFGMAIMQSTTKLLETSCGSPHYVSPEIVRGIPYYGPATDVWSAGIILYVLLTGKLPFDDCHVGRLLAKIKAGRFKPIPDWVSSSARDLIYRMLIVDPKQRITFNDILSHPWLLSIDSSRSSCTSTTVISNNSIPTMLSIHSFSFRCNPWYDDQLKSPLIVNSNDLDGPTTATLKVLWRDLSQDEIVSALMETSPNVQKLTYQLLQQRQKRHWDRLERSTYSMKSNCDTEQIRPDDDLVPFYDYDDGLLSPPPEKEGQVLFRAYQTPALIKRLHSFNPMMLLHVSHLDHIYLNNIRGEKPWKHRPTSHQHVSLIPTSLVTSALTRIRTYTLKTCKGLFKSIFKPASLPPKNNDTVSFYCSAKSEFTAAGKLHYILSEQFNGKLTGCMYPDGKVLWSGRINDITQEDHCKSSFICRMRKSSSRNTMYKIKVTRCDATLIYPVIDMLSLYEQESDNVLRANAWYT